MPSDVFLEGASEGSRCVKKYLSNVHSATSTEDLGAIAGLAWVNLSTKDEYVIRHTFAKSKDFREGFFEGFMSRCDDLNRK